MFPASEVEGTVIAAQGQAPREARLRPDHAHRYPGIRPEKWETAAVVADRVLASWLLRGNDLAIRGRVLLEAHFEFRGGRERGGEREGARPRREDR
ncbi:MAG TPA: hypothetical protein VHR41_19470 [Gemmatimonadales bacterium]|jgi:hypothetical protein|nr:hypothetical protein [Gemmatimonadales bacterium]